MAITMKKGEFKLYMLNVIEHMDEQSESYRRFCDMFLTATGVIDADGSLTREYAASPYWNVDGNGVLSGAAKAAVNNNELMLALSPEARKAVLEMA